MSYDGPYPAGEVQGLPRGDGETEEALVDFTITFRWPLDLTITLGAVNNTADLSIAKTGSIQVYNGYNTQRFYQTGASFFWNDFVYNTDFEVFRISVTSQTGNGTIEIAPVGFIDNQPNVQIDYFQASSGAGGSPDIYEYYPPDISGGATLSIDLLSFNARKFRETGSLISWSIASALTTSHFELYRSSDGMYWDNIARVGSTGAETYSYIDDGLRLRSGENVYYYRLKIVDRDGSYFYSDIKNVKFLHEDERSISIYPNPAGNKSVLDLSALSPADGRIEVLIYDMSGKHLVKSWIALNPTENIDLSGLPENTYNILVHQGENVYNAKLVKAGN
jgi:hypothetical protein